MKVIKLDRRHKGYRHGFTHALRFGPVDQNYPLIYTYFARMYPREYKYHLRTFAHDKWMEVSSKHAYPNQINWICVKNETLLTMALLTIANN